MRIPSFFLILIAAATLVQPATAQDHLALITELKGEVAVVRPSGSQATATWGMQLFQGDVVKTGAAAKAAILFSNNNLLSMGANSEMAISGGSEVSGGRSVDPGLTADVSDLTLHRTGVGEIAALGGLRSGGRDLAIRPVTPHNARARAARPTFTWIGGSEFERYRVKVLDQGREIWSQETEATSIVYPDDAPALEADGTYFWQVEGEEMLDVVKSPMVQFQVLSPAALDRVSAGEQEIAALFIDDSGTSRDYMLGAFYAREGLAEEAIEAFERIALAHPESPFVQEVLGKLYYETGRKDEAVAALQRAIQLGADK